MLKRGFSGRLAISILIIALVALILYANLLSPQAGRTLFPWASDTFGHILKVDYLRQMLAQGVLYPNLLPQWYLGQQVMRYYPPLPYYMLAGLSWVIGNDIAAANWFIVICALVGGLAWLLYRRWIGWLLALAGGVLFTFLPDNLRVALSEGNLPRLLATAVLPFALYFLLRSLEESASFRYRLGLGLCFAVVVLCHAMMAAIYAVCFTLVGGALWLGRAVPARRVIFSVASIALGIMLSGWWLLPSLTGGITELNTSAMTEALAVFSIPHYLNPLARVGNPETSYVGAALLLISLFSLFFRSTRNRYTLALTLTGLAGVIITTPGFNEVFNALPLHNLLWPLRFLGIASFLLLLGILWSLSLWPKRYALVGAAVMALIAADGAGSLFLIHMSPLRPDILEISQRLASSQGWREATLDLSRLGSSPSMYFTSVGGREQVFGWAYQGARTAPTVYGINEAVERGLPAYVADRFDLLGVDDVVLLKGLPKVAQVYDALARSGFKLVYQGSQVDLYHRDGSPRAVVAPKLALGIGRGAQNLAYLFPEMILGASTRVDDYSLDEFTRYKTVVLSGFDWKKQSAAEDLVRQAAQRGVNFVVDLTGSPPDPWARIPHFLDVWGEQLVLGADPVDIHDGNINIALKSFSDGTELWLTHMLQGLQVDAWTSTYLGDPVVLSGYNQYGSGKVWFIGLNLAYHAVLTQDPGAIRLLADTLQLPASQPDHYQAVPLQNYQPAQNGYRFQYQLDAPQRLLLPVASIEGLVVHIDGSTVPAQSYEYLLAFDAPAGQHAVSITFTLTWIYLLGWLTTLAALIGFYLSFDWERR